MTPNIGAVRAARALRSGCLQAVEERDLDALLDNLAGWMGTDFDVRAAVLSAEKDAA